MNHCPNCNAYPFIFDGDFGFHVECPHCGLRGPRGNVVGDDEGSKRVAVRNWNAIRVDHE